MNRFAVALIAFMASNQALGDQEQLGLSAPRWLRDYKFEPAHFTFVRIKYDDVAFARRARRRPGGPWATDHPDADRAISKHLATVTSLQVDPNGKVLRLTDSSLSGYPFIYISEPGRMQLTDAEVEAVRRYLLDGGFLMIDDFWGEREWENVYEVMKRVFPDREPMEIPLGHRIFHCVYDIKEKPQVPSIHAYYSGWTAEREDANQVNFMAIYDDSKKMMVLICHNTDLADGWESIDEGGDYAREVSVKKAMPMGINVIFYALTQDYRGRLAERSRYRNLRTCGGPIGRSSGQRIGNDRVHRNRRPFLEYLRQMRPKRHCTLRSRPKRRTAQNYNAFRASAAHLRVRIHTVPNSVMKACPLPVKRNCGRWYLQRSANAGHTSCSSKVIQETAV